MSALQQFRWPGERLNGVISVVDEYTRVDAPSEQRLVATNGSGNLAPEACPFEAAVAPADLRPGDCEQQQVGQRGSNRDVRQTGRFDRLNGIAEKPLNQVPNDASH